MTFGPSDRYYDPPDPVICCAECEDDDGHDVDQCLADQAEDNAERVAERQREDMMFGEAA